MARPRRIDLDLVAQARQVTRQAQNLAAYRQAMSILLPADLSASLEQTAHILGVGRATVHRLQTQFREQRQRSGLPRRTWGGAPSCPAESSRRREFPQTLGRTGPNWRSVGRLAPPGSVSPTAGPPGGRFGRVSLFGPARLAQGGPRHAPSQSRPADSRGLEKKLPEVLAGLLKPEVVCGRPVRLMFQDEARFGRMVRLRRCWAPAPLRPTVPNGYERQFVCVYGAVSPLDGELDWKRCADMNTERMNEFLAQVSQAHPDAFIVMILDGASSHKSRDLRVPENIRLHRLPGYSPELNPQEHVWDELREKEFPNRVFDSMEGVISQLESGLPRLAANRDALRSLTAWPWIVSLNLNAN